MTKTMARILAFICALGTMILLLGVRVISPAEGSHELIYSVPGDRGVAEATQEGLEAEIRAKHGDTEPVTTIGTIQWKDEEAELLERIDHEYESMGLTLGGKRYISCTVRTTRNAVRGQKILEAADHTITYIACDSTGDGKAEILWDTLEENSSKHWDKLQLS